MSKRKGFVFPLWDFCAQALANKGGHQFPENSAAMFTKRETSKHLYDTFSAVLAQGKHKKMCTGEIVQGIAQKNIAQ